MVYSGKIYETDGANPVAVHEAESVRPLIPIPHAPSLRIFRTDLMHGADFEPSEPRFFYGNPGGLAGASQVINPPEDSVQLGVLPMVAAVIVADAYQVDVSDADDLVLGYTMMTLLVSERDFRLDRLAGTIGRSHDIGGVVGPVITTPDELEDAVESQEYGRRYSLTSVLRVNGVERARGGTADLPFSFAQAISFASQTCTLKIGDIFATGPAVDTDDESDRFAIEPGDEVTLAVEKLGALSLKLSS
jgi:2-keto-4-pentenoate hydratase/2-oxohepta-3-ene-1,7-dioic acid hydratase in catechol pathway